MDVKIRGQMTIFAPQFYLGLWPNVPGYMAKSKCMAIAIGHSDHTRFYAHGYTSIFRSIAVRIGMANIVLEKLTIALRILLF